MILKTITVYLIAAALLLSCKSGKEKKDSKTYITTERKWWKEAAVYQIYPRSFKDSDGDGVGEWIKLSVYIN